MNVFLLILGCGLALFPLVMLIHACWHDHVMSARLALSAVVCHVIILLESWMIGQPYVTLGYLVLVNLLWIYALLFGGTIDRVMRRRIHKVDLAKYQRIIRRDPGHAGAHSALADAYLERGQYDLAIAEYEQAIQLDPDNSRPDRLKLKQAIALRAGSNGARSI
jgi:tetratricopeptide (TPR) repeat protein